MAGETPRETFMRNLAAERGETPAEESAAQPQADEDPQKETSAETEAAGADDVDEAETEALSDSETDEETQPQAGDGTGITVDGEEWTPDSIRDLKAQFHSLDSKTKQTWRDQATNASHHRREFKGRMELLEVQDKQYARLAEGNLAQLAGVDVSKLTPEQFQRYHQDRQKAEHGVSQLKQWQNQQAEERKAAAESLKDDEASATQEWLKATEPRWSNEFYGKLQAFAVDNLGYTPEEFADVTEVRAIEGLKAQYDLHALQTRGEVLQREPKKPSKRQKATQQRRARNERGQFQATEKEVLSSPNARKDGSFKRMMEQRLAAERR